MASEPMSSPSRMLLSSGGQCGDPPVFQACCLAPDSLHGSFDLTNICNTTPDLDAVASASRESAASFLMLVNRLV